MMKFSPKERKIVSEALTLLAAKREREGDDAKEVRALLAAHEHSCLVEDFHEVGLQSDGVSAVR